MLLKTVYKMKPPVSARINHGHSLADKLIAAYLFNEGSGLTAFNSSGYGHHGSFAGGVSWVVGKYGRVLDFDGTDGYVNIDGLTVSGGNVTFVVWVKSSMADEARICIIAFWPENFRFYFQTSTPGSIGVFNGSGWVDFGDTPNDGFWHQIVLSINGTSATMYIDAAVLSTQTISSIDISAASEAKIGAFFDGLTHFMNGQIGHLMIYGRGLKLSEIKLLYRRSFCMFDRRLGIVRL